MKTIYQISKQRFHCNKTLLIMLSLYYLIRMKILYQAFIIWNYVISKMEYIAQAV